MFGNPLQAFINIEAQLQVFIDNQLLAEAMSAIDPANLSDRERNAIFVLPGDAVRPYFFGCPVLFPYQVIFHAETVFSFKHGRDDLFADRTVRVVAIHQGCEVGGCPPGCFECLQCMTFRIGQIDELLKLFNRVYAVSHLLLPFCFHLRPHFYVRLVLLLNNFMAGVNVVLANQLLEFGRVLFANHRDNLKVSVADFFGFINIGPVFVKEEV